MPKRYSRPKQTPKTYKQVLSRVSYLRALNEPQMLQRSRIRALANGGVGAMNVLLKDLPTNDDTELAVNHIKSGIERFSEMIGLVPEVRVDAPENDENDKASRAASKRERIINSYDELSGMEQQLEQASMWYPGYGFFAWKVCEALNPYTGYRYPKAELRDPYSTWPAEWGVGQQPEDIAFQRWIDPATLTAQYPHAEAALKGRKLPGGAVDLATFTPRTTPGWDGVTGGVEVIEYVDGYGTYMMSPLVDGFLDVFEHPLSRPPFVVVKRTSFDALHGQFDSAIGAASAIAKATLLQRIAMEDAVFAPMVVTGRVDGPIRKGRDSVIYAEGGDVKYVQQNLPYQAFAEVERVEKYLRQMTGYSKQIDGESPMSFVTGQGLEELGSTVARQVERAQSAFKRGLETLSAIQLEWDEVAYGSEKKPLEGVRKGAVYSEEYLPEKDIDGNYRTRRVYGLMSGLDDARRGVALLQYLAAGVIDIETVQEQVRGIDNPQKVRDRILSKKVEDTLFESLLAMAQQNDPTVTSALIELHRDPKRFDAILEEFFGPQEEEPEPEMPAGPDYQSALGGLAGGGADVLTRLTSAGQAQGGIQTMRTVGQ